MRTRPDNFAGGRKGGWASPAKLSGRRSATRPVSVSAYARTDTRQPPSVPRQCVPLSRSGPNLATPFFIFARNIPGESRSTRDGGGAPIPRRATQRGCWRAPAAHDPAELPLTRFRAISAQYRSAPESP